MTIEEHTVIDFVGLDADGNVAMTISDHLPWSDVTGHLYQLQEKINSYLRFVESGEIYENFPALKNRPIVINVTLKYEHPIEVQWFFTKSAAVIAHAGCKLNVKVL